MQDFAIGRAEYGKRRFRSSLYRKILHSIARTTSTSTSRRPGRRTSEKTHPRAETGRNTTSERATKDRRPRYSWLRPRRDFESLAHTKSSWRERDP